MQRKTAQQKRKEIQKENTPKKISYEQKIKKIINKIEDVNKKLEIEILDNVELLHVYAGIIDRIMGKVLLMEIRLNMLTNKQSIWKRLTNLFRRKK